MSYALTHWRRHSGGGRRSHRYGRDGGAAMSTGAKVALGISALAAGAAVFLLARPAQAAQAPAQIPTTPPSPGATPATPPAAPPVATNQTIAQVTTHDPPTSGDLNLFDAPNGNRIGGAEKDSIVRVLSNDGTFAQIQTNNAQGRYPDQTGFVHAKFLANPDPSRVAQGIGDAALGAAQAVLSGFGF